MLSLLRSRTALGLLYNEAAPMVIAMVIAELFFKFHSFTLETLAFLAVWCLLGAIHRLVLTLLHRVIPLVPAPDQWG